MAKLKSATPQTMSMDAASRPVKLVHTGNNKGITKVNATRPLKMSNSNAVQ